MTEYFRYHIESVHHVGEPDTPVTFYTRDAVRTPRRRTIAERDVTEVIAQAFLWAALSLAHPNRWQGICAMTARIGRPRWMRRSWSEFHTRITAVLPDYGEAAAAKLVERYRARLYERRAAVLRETTRPGPVTFQIAGKNRLDDALEENRGAILWATPFMFQSLPGKRGLAEAGFKLHQVSSAQHGFSDTVFAERVLNPRTIAAENTHLESRLVFDGRDASMALRRAVRLLQTGETVIFTNNAFAGRHFVQLPFGSGAWISMSVTPIRLALRHKVPLLLVATAEREPFASYDIAISENMTAAMAEMNEDEAVATIALRTRDWMLDMVRADPDQFLGFQTLPIQPITSTAT